MLCCVYLLKDQDEVENKESALTKNCDKKEKGP